MRKALAAAFLAVATSACAGISPESCRSMEGLGCAFVPDEAPEKPPLLIYLRGWLAPYDGRVPPSACLASARQAFKRYALGETARAAKAALLVTCSSDRGVTEGDVAALEKASGTAFAERILAAHSGGYVGLERTLAAGLAFSRLLMLDDFYFGAELSPKIQARISGGVSCAGFYTAHNLARYETRFKPSVSCAVEPHDDFGHDETVVKCLAAYLTKNACP